MNRFFVCVRLVELGVSLLMLLLVLYFVSVNSVRIVRRIGCMFGILYVVFVYKFFIGIVRILLISCKSVDVMDVYIVN